MDEKRRAAARTVLPLALLLLSPATAAAQAEGNPPEWCRNGAFADSAARFRLGRVKGARGARVHFHKDADGCPSPVARCREKAYVVPGDEVVVAHDFGRWACAWYQPARGSETVGWIDTDSLDIKEAVASPPSARWLGEWRLYDNSLTIRRAGAGRLSVSGHAFWRGLGDNIHVGEVEGEVVPAGDRFAYEDDECRVAAQLVGPFLVVNDNNRCGGANVTFDGVYRKRPARGR